MTKTQYMTPFKRGSVVLLPFPYTDQSGTKRRPAVVLSNQTYNDDRGDLIVAPITSNLSTRQTDDTVLNDWTVAGLVKPSVVKGILGTVERKLVIRQLGNLSSADLVRVTEAFAVVLGMSFAT